MSENEKVHVPEVIAPGDITICNLTDASIAELKEKYSKLDSLDLTVKEDYEFVRLGIREMVGYRTNIERSKKEKTEKARTYTNAVNEEASKRTDQIRDIEAPLKEVKKKQDEAKTEQKRIEKEAADKRIGQLNAKLDEIGQFLTSVQGKPTNEIVDAIRKLEAYDVSPEVFFEMKNQAIVKKQGTLENLDSLLETTREAEDEKKSLEEERKQLDLDKAKLAEQTATREAEDKRVKAIKDSINKINQLVVSAHTGKEIHEIHEISEEISEMFVLGVERFEEFLDEAAAASARARDTLDKLIETKTEGARQEKVRLEQEVEQKRIDDEKEKLEKEKLELSEREENERKAKNEKALTAIIEHVQNMVKIHTTFDALEAEVEEFCETYDIVEKFDDDFVDKAAAKKAEQISMLRAKVAGLREKEEAERKKKNTDYIDVVMSKGKDVMNNQHNQSSGRFEIAIADFFKSVIIEKFVDDDYQEEAQKMKDQLRQMMTSVLDELKEKEKIQQDKDDVLAAKVSELRDEAVREVVGIVSTYEEHGVQDLAEALVNAIEYGEISHITADWTVDDEE